MIDLRVLELLCARFCHELVSPVGAISNGAELLGEDDPDFVREAIGLIEQSSRAASKRLQFYRFAYGTTSAAASAAPRELLLGILEGGKVSAEWAEPVSGLPVDWQRVACNLAIVAAETLPRGGRIVVRQEEGASMAVAVEASGDTVLVNEDVVAALAGSVAPSELTSRTIHGYVTAQFAGRLGALASLKESAANRALFVAAAR